MAANSRLQRDYFCTRCGKKTDRDKLTVKKAVFTDMGSRAKTHKSRVTRQLCPQCLLTDDDWTKPAYAEPEFETMPEGFADEDDDKPVLGDPEQPMLPGMEMLDSEGRAPGDPKYCAPGCIHVPAHS